MSRGHRSPALRRAHAHNDYAHDRPFHDAVDRGFTSIEADVWLVDGELLVAHELDEVRPERTLASLYLEPLAAAVAADPATPWLLLIDLKSEGVSTYLAVEDALLPYAAILTRFAPDPRPGPVEVVVSGDRPLPTLLARRPRHTGYDGRLPDLLDTAPVSEPASRVSEPASLRASTFRVSEPASLRASTFRVSEPASLRASVEETAAPRVSEPASLRASTFRVSEPASLRASVEETPTQHSRLDRSIMPMISADWARFFTWRGIGSMPPAERALLERIVGLAHGAGQRVRFWNTPDEPGAARDAVWTLLCDLGVDHLNSDDLDGLARFLQGRGSTVD